MGSFGLGLVVGIIENHIVPPQLQLFVTIGLLGAVTTFSTFSFETWALVEVGSIGKALLNILASVGVGLAAVLAGLLAGRAI
jgi:CrcB protein